MFFFSPNLLDLEHMNISITVKGKRWPSFQIYSQNVWCFSNCDPPFRFGGGNLCPARKCSSPRESWIQDDHFIRRNMIIVVERKCHHYYRSSMLALKISGSLFAKHAWFLLHFSFIYSVIFSQHKDKRTEFSIYVK